MSPRLKHAIPILIAAIWLAATGVAAAKVDFNRDIKPILERHCHECHGALRRSGGLRLDIRSGAERGGETGVSLLEAGRANNEIHRRVTSTAHDYLMPRKRPPLSDAEIDTIGLWADQGASWPENAGGTIRRDSGQGLATFCGPASGIATCLSGAGRVG